MIAFHIALYSILATSLVFAIVELGLSAYVASFWGGTSEELYYDAYGNYGYRDVTVSIPGILAFLIFTSCWTILITPAGVVLSWFYTRKGASGKISTILGVVFAVVYFVTMVFWLACFADIASYLGGYTSYSDYLNAVIAFAVLLWYSPKVVLFPRENLPALLTLVQASLPRSLHPLGFVALWCPGVGLGGLSVDAQADG